MMHHGGHGAMGKGHAHGGMMGGGKPMMREGMGKSCPMAVPGTTATAEEREGGAALVFTTTGDVAELRRRVTAMAEMHNKHQGHGCPMMAKAPATP
jgi:hypothetical protein